MIKGKKEIPFKAKSFVLKDSAKEKFQRKLFEDTTFYIGW